MAVCTALLADLGERYRDTPQPTLLALDGGQALHAAVKRILGPRAP